MYALSVAFSWVVFSRLGSVPDPTSLFVTYAAATAFVFTGSLLLNNTSVYDPYWSVAPLGLFLLSASHSEAELSRILWFGFVVFVWGLRLTYSFFRGWPGLHHEDFRYQTYREKLGVGYWPFSFLALHFFPSVLTFLGSLPFVFALSGARDGLGPMELAGGILALLAVGLEERADGELHRYKKARRTSDSILETGVWAWCRHPNYLGEILFWWGLGIMGYSASKNPLSLLGALLITCLFALVSVRLMDARMQKSRPGYAARMATVPALIPRVPRKPK